MNNMPIVYVSLPMFKENNFIYGGYESELYDDIESFITTRCYLIKEIKEYELDGTYKINYEIAPTIIKSNYSYEYENNKIIYDVRSNVINSIYVYEIYNDYNECKEKTNEKNELLKEYKIKYNLDTIENIEKKQIKYQLIENEIDDISYELVKYRKR